MKVIACATFFVVLALVLHYFCFCLCTEAGMGSSLPVPTKDMAKLWARVRQLRAFLRTQKQEYKVSSANPLPVNC